MSVGLSTAVFKMKSVLALTFLPLLASSLKILPQSRETYASYAAKNRIVTDDGKCGREQQVLDCYDYFSQQGTTYRYINTNDIYLKVVAFVTFWLVSSFGD